MSISVNAPPWMTMRIVQQFFNFIVIFNIIEDVGQASYMYCKQRLLTTAAAVTLSCRQRHLTTFLHVCSNYRITSYFFTEDEVPQRKLHHKVIKAPTRYAHRNDTGGKNGLRLPASVKVLYDKTKAPNEANT